MSWWIAAVLLIIAGYYFSVHIFGIVGWLMLLLPFIILGIILLIGLIFWFLAYLLEKFV
jgi:hypothetical protein